MLSYDNFVCLKSTILLEKWGPNVHLSWFLKSMAILFVTLVTKKWKNRFVSIIFFCKRKQGTCCFASVKKQHVMVILHYQQDNCIFLGWERREERREEERCGSILCLFLIFPSYRHYLSRLTWTVLWITSLVLEHCNRVF